MFYGRNLGSQHHDGRRQSSPSIPRKYEQGFGSLQAVDRCSDEDRKNHMDEKENGCDAFRGRQIAAIIFNELNL